jgi:sigma-E factor negative regulatory protein RseC
MEQTVKVRRLLPDGKAEVIRIRESACSGECHKCAGCGAAQQTMLFTAENPIGAAVGDMVVVTTETAPVLKAAAVLYIVPLLLFLAGYIAGSYIGKGAGWLGAAGFLLGIAGVVWYDRRTAKKKNTIYTITGFVA